MKEIPRGWTNAFELERIANGAVDAANKHDILAAQEAIRLYDINRPKIETLAIAHSFDERIKYAKRKIASCDESLKDGEAYRTPL